MKLKEDIAIALERNGWKATRLAREAGVAPPVVTRIMSGKRVGVRLETLKKLWPFIYPGTPMPGGPTDKAA